MFAWDDARFLLAVHRTRSLSAAGRELGVNQSTVGRRLRALEEALGIRVFVQTPDGFVLADTAERLLARASRMEEEALAMEREASGSETRLVGTVRITGPDALSARILAPLLAELHERLPGIDFELAAENRTYSLSKREADMAIRTQRPREAAVVMRRICPFVSTVYASEEYLAAHGRPRESNLARHPFVGVEDAAWQESLWLDRVVPGARVPFKSNSTMSQLAATLGGVGLGILPCYIADPEPSLVRVVPLEKGITRELWLVLHRDLQHAPRIRACADFLTEALTARARSFAGTLSRGRSA